MEKQYHAFVQFDNVLIDSKQRKRILHNPTDSIENSLNADRMFLNNELINVIKRFWSKIEFTIFYRYTKKPVVEQILKNCMLVPNNRIHLLPASQLVQRSVIPQVDKVENQHVLFFICEDTLFSEIKNQSGYSNLLKQNNISICHILPSFYWFAFSDFLKHIRRNDYDIFKLSYLFAENSSHINNFLAYLLDIPEEARFLYRRQFRSPPEKEENKPNEKTLLQNDFLSPYYLFDYYSIKVKSKEVVEYISSRRKSSNNIYSNEEEEFITFRDQFTSFMVKKLKDAEISNTLSIFFAKALIYYFRSSIDINKCAFLVYPSSQKGGWNNSILSALKDELDKVGYHHDTLKSLYRLYTVEKQHLSGDRSIKRQLDSIELRLPNISQFDFAIVADDLTTTGTSFTVAETILRENGFQGNILNFATAGTKKSYNKTLFSTKHFPRMRPLCTNAYIFDLDNTLIGSDNAKEFRESKKKDWNKAIECIPDMKQFYCVVDAVKRLIQKGIDVAVVTSSTAEYCYSILQYLGISINDVVCVTYYDTKKHKPNPDPYILAERQFRHNNLNIFCIGDQLNDLIACDEANQRDRYHNYVPALALWNQGWQIQQSHSDNKLKVFFSEIQLLEFLGFIIPAKQSLYDLIHYYIRPTFVDLAWIDEQFYNMLQKQNYIDDQDRITDIGKRHGISYLNMSKCSKIERIILDYESQLQLIETINNCF